MTAKDFFRLPALPESKFRLLTLAFSLGLGLAGAFLCVSVSAAFFDLGRIISQPGSFFVSSYGLMAFSVPAYLLCAALLLADPLYRPERIFVLGTLIFPFFTMAAGFYCLREFEIIRYESYFISLIGKLGIGLFTFFLTAIELLIIALMRFLLFKGRAPSEESFSEPAAMPVFNAGPPKAAFSEPAFFIRKRVFTEPSTEPLVEMPLAEVPSAEPAEALEFLPGKNSEAIPQSGIADVDADADADVEKALAEAEAFAAAHAEEEAARHEAPLSIVPRRNFSQKHGRYSVPVEGILKQYPDGEYWIIDEDTREAALTLKETFKEFNIQVEVTGIRKGPVITMFEILPAPGIRLAKIENLADNIALRLAAQSVRIVAPIPGKHAVGIEVPNIRRNIVSFREIIEGELSREGKKPRSEGPQIPVVLGKDITGEAVTVDLVQMPHLLIAGSTGSGKSVCVNSMILSLLYQKSPAECRLILIDPKIVELKLYNDIPHLLTPVITESKKAFQALQYCIYEMERRYSCLDSMGVRDIRSYNRRIEERRIATEYMPYIVVMIDEFADLMATTGKELESTVARLAAMSRAVGIHLVLATQRPSIDVITGLIKANIPSRIAFMVASKMDSRIIIDMVGAEKLLGKGDMLYAGALDPFPVRMQGAYVSEEEVERVVDYVKSLGEPDYIDDEIFFEDEEEIDPSLFSDGEDPLYDKAIEIVVQQGRASASYIQRRLKIGYNRAARLVELMEHKGLVGPAQGSKPRELLRGA
ncbi:MAG: FtsK/SpoIIIE domain-containing protein [Treponema sp.]|nr:FtsK/SpoIIIE domain-containing protein [Treponema sp.]